MVDKGHTVNCVSVGESVDQRVPGVLDAVDEERVELDPVARREHGVLLDLRAALGSEAERAETLAQLDGSGPVAEAEADEAIHVAETLLPSAQDQNPLARILVARRSLKASASRPLQEVRRLLAYDRLVQMREIAPGLWRWTVRHPEWTPEEEWPPEVGCVAYETGDTLVLIDPLVPPDDAESIWPNLDARVERTGRAPDVLISLFWHARSAQAILDRYAEARVWAHAPARELVAERTAWTDLFRAGDPLPGAVEAIDARRAFEVLFWLPDHRTLVAGDVLLGAEDGGIRILPDSWLGGVERHSSPGSTPSSSYRSSASCPHTASPYSRTAGRRSPARSSYAHRGGQAVGREARSCRRGRECGRARARNRRWRDVHRRGLRL
jgi:hypothetical protein